jgi:DNA-binding LacI/PurR family transcriptional regulator
MIISTDAPENRRPATAHDVARRAGVSRSTVSFILNGNGDRFLEETRLRVTEAAAALDYHPSLAGRALVSGRSGTIVLLLPSTTFGENLQDAVDQITSEHLAPQTNVVVRFAGADHVDTTQALIALQPAAVVNFGVLLQEDGDRLKARGIVMVPDEPPLGKSGDGGVAALQAEALLERGQRDLWFVALADKRSDAYGPRRFEALEAWCADHDRPPPRRTVSPLTLHGAVRSLQNVLSQSDLPVGLACYNDDVALAMLAAAKKLGLDIPTDLSAIGVDHTAVGQLWSPALTTVDTDIRGFTRALSSELRARLNGERTPSDTSQAISMSLVRGGTH